MTHFWLNTKISKFHDLKNFKSPQYYRITAKFGFKSTYSSSFQPKRKMTDFLPSKILESQTFKNLILARKIKMINLFHSFASCNSSGSMKSGIGVKLPGLNRPLESFSALLTPGFACLSRNPGYELEISNKIPLFSPCCLDVGTSLPLDLDSESSQPSPGSKHPEPSSDDSELKFSFKNLIPSELTASVLPLSETKGPISSSLASTKRLSPCPSVPYDPDVIFEYDSDEDLSVYCDSDDDDDSCFGFDRSAPCLPRPLDLPTQPTVEGHLAWLGERGLCSFYGSSINLLSESDLSVSQLHFSSSTFSWGLAPITPTGSPPHTFSSTPSLPLMETQALGLKVISTGAPTLTPAQDLTSSLLQYPDPPLTLSLPFLSSAHTETTMQLEIENDEYSWVTSADSVCALAEDCGACCCDSSTSPSFPPLPTESSLFISTLLIPLDSLPSLFVSLCSFFLLLLLPPQSPHTPPSHQMNLQHLLQHLPEYDYAQPNSRRTLFGLTVRRPPKLHLLKSSLPSMAWGGWKNCRENLDRPRVSLMSRHTGEFSLSANEKPRMRPAIVHFYGPHRPRRSSLLINFGLKAPWSPRSSARRRLERLRAGRGHCPPVCCSYGVPILKIKPPLNIILNIID